MTDPNPQGLPALTDEQKARCQMIFDMSQKALPRIGLAMAEGIAIGFAQASQQAPGVSLEDWNGGIDAAIELVRDALRTEGSVLTYNAAHEVQLALRALKEKSVIASPAAPVATVASSRAAEGRDAMLDRHEREILEVIDQRDKYHEIADELSLDVAAYLGVDIGEHTSGNFPWQNAIDALAESPTLRCVSE